MRQIFDAQSRIRQLRGAGSAPFARSAFQPQPHPPPHVSRPRSVPAMKPTAPCAVTLPAHQPRASHRRPLRAICRHPAGWRFESQRAAYAHKPPFRASCPDVWRDAQSVTNHARPSLARALLCRHAQCIPSRPKIRTVEAYKAFLAERRRTITSLDEFPRTDADALP